MVSFCIVILSAPFRKSRLGLFGPRHEYVYCTTTTETFLYWHAAEVRLQCIHLLLSSCFWCLFICLFVVVVVFILLLFLYCCYVVVLFSSACVFTFRLHISLLWTLLIAQCLETIERGERSADGSHPRLILACSSLPAGISSWPSLGHPQRCKSLLFAAGRPGSFLLGLCPFTCWCVVDFVVLLGHTCSENASVVGE